MTETRSFRADVRADEAEGIVSVSIPIYRGLDSFGTGWDKGVFDEHLKSNRPKVVGWDHNAGQRFGVVRSAKSTKDGYDFEAAFNLKSREGAEAFEQIRFNLENDSPDDWSFRFDAQDTRKDDDGNVVFTRAKIFEISPVLVGAVAESATTAARSGGDDDKGDGEMTRAIELTITTEVEQFATYDKLMRSLAEIGNAWLEELAVIEEYGDELRIGKKISTKSLTALKDAHSLLGEIIEGAEPEPENDDDDAPLSEGQLSAELTDEDARAALAAVESIVGTSSEGEDDDGDASGTD